jgi:phosphoglycerate dehydrogenase-like enzyme
MPGVMMPEGMASEWVMDTALPSASTTLRWVVSRGTGVDALDAETLAGADLGRKLAGHVLGE